jgi:LPXTG-site transpeptidase (sortase) family protein
MFKDIKTFWKAFAIFFLISFLIINWNTISWVFNYRALQRYLSVTLEKKEEATSTNFMETATGSMENNNTQNLLKPNSIEISKIGISAPLITDKNLSDSEVYKALDNGVVYYPDSALPGETGQTIILGHSAPANWPKIKYDWVFSNINNLQAGDEISVYFNNEKFEYSVTRKIFLERGEEIPKDGLANSKNVLILISCWPPGKDYKRIAVEAVIK